MDGADEEDCDMDIDFICKPNLYHSTPKVSSIDDHSRKLSLTSCDNISPLANPLTPDDKSFATKVKEQVKFKRCISVLQPIGLDDLSLAKPRETRLKELNVSRFNEEFMILDEIGKGAQSYVYKCLFYMNGCIYAVKITSGPIESDIEEKMVKNEIYAHCVLSHENILRNYSNWIEDDHAFIQNEYCDLGSLEEYVKTNVMSEYLLRSLLLQMVNALKYIHNKGVAHMDIKPENIFLKSNDTPRMSDNDDSGVCEKIEDDIIFKLGDFSYMTKINQSDVNLDEESVIEEDDCRYLPREVLEGNLKYLDKCDIFSLGLTVYEVSTGGPLSKKEDEWQEIRNGNLKSLKNLSQEFSDILKSMIHPQPERRPSASNLKNMVQLSNSLFQNTEDDLSYMHQYYHGNKRLEHQVETSGHYLRELFKSHGQYQDQFLTGSASFGSYSRKRNGSGIKTRTVGKKTKRSNSTMF